MAERAWGRIAVKHTESAAYTRVSIQFWPAINHGEGLYRGRAMHHAGITENAMFVQTLFKIQCNCAYGGDVIIGAKRKSSRRACPYAIHVCAPVTGIFFRN